MTEHSSTDVDSTGARVEDAVREGSDDRVREARGEAVERAADAGLIDAQHAPQDAESSITGTGRAAATDDPGRAGSAGGDDEGVAQTPRGGTGSPQVAATTSGGTPADGEPTAPASGRMGDATYGSGLAGGEDRDGTPAAHRGDRPEPGAEHLHAPAEARNPANESSATLGIDDTDTALADEDAT